MTELNKLQNEWIKAHNKEVEWKNKKIEIENKILSLGETPDNLKITRTKNIVWEQDKLTEVIEKNHLENFFEKTITWKAKGELFDKDKNLTQLLPNNIRNELEEIYTLKENKPTFSEKK